jgi:hypothetical protein
MSPIKEFAAFEGKVYAATTRRVYLSAAKKALTIVGKTPENCGSYQELLASLRENLPQKHLPKGLRIAPFLRFLDSKIPKKPENIPDYGPIRAWVIDHIAIARKGGGFEVKLWDKPVEAPGLALALLYWHTWRERLDRPEQSRLHRKGWAYSDLLFPNSKGEVLGRQAIHDALSRLSVQGEGGVRLTPELIRQAFLQLKA